MDKNNEEDNIDALFNRVASKLGWFENQLDLQDNPGIKGKHKKKKKVKKRVNNVENKDPENKNDIKHRQHKNNKNVPPCGTGKKTPKAAARTKRVLIENKETVYGGKNNETTLQSNVNDKISENVFVEKSCRLKNNVIHDLLDEDLDAVCIEADSLLPTVCTTSMKELIQKIEGDSHTGGIVTCSPLDLSDGCLDSPLPEGLSVRHIPTQDVHDSNNSSELLSSESVEQQSDIFYTPLTNFNQFYPESKARISSDVNLNSCVEINAKASYSPGKYFSAEDKFTESGEPIKWHVSSSNQEDQPIKSKLSEEIKVTFSESEDDSSDGLQTLKDRLKKKWKTKNKTRQSSEIKDKSSYRIPSKIMDSSSSEDNFESFLENIRTPSKRAETVDTVDFINDAPLSISSDDDDDYFHARLSQNDSVFCSTNREDTKPKFRRQQPVFQSLTLDSDDDDSVFATHKLLPKTKKPSHTAGDDSVFKTPKSYPTFSTGSIHRKNKPTITTANKTPSDRCITSSSSSIYFTPLRSHDSSWSSSSSFLKSLSTPYKGTSSPSPYINNFSKTRDKLIQKLFLLYNETVFINELPSDFKITWNKRMRKTAGFCYYSKNRVNKERCSRIELSDKVCDSAERLRDTLIHELCHAAAWLIHGVSDGHGKFWKYWAAKANIAHPEIPVIMRCHSYEINTKYKYDCKTCGNTIGRHSKSLNTSKYRCGYCRGELTLRPQLNKDGVPIKPRSANKFALYVKDNYGTIKKDCGYMKHADVMRVLSQEFSNKSKITA